MENRFGLKDLILLVLLGILIVVVLLAMKQYDRQWDVLQQMQRQGAEQTRELINIERLLQSGITLNNPTTSATTQGSSTSAGAFGDPFKYVKEAKAIPGFAPGDWFVDNFGTKVGKLTPLISSDVYSTIVGARVQESLAYRDPETLEYLPLLAQSWQTSENIKPWQEYVDKRKMVPLTEAEVLQDANCPPADKAADRKAYVERRVKEGRQQDDIVNEKDCPIPYKITFQLRRGIQFSDGVPMTADDIVFTFNFIMNPKIDAPRDRAYLEKIRSVEKNGDYEVTFNFREPYFESFDLASGLGPMPKHFYEKFTPEQFNNSTGLLMGTGPYKLADPETWHPGDKIELIRNDRYWGEPGTFDRLVFLQVEGEVVEMTMFKNGEVDRFGATPEQYKLLLKDQALVARTRHFEIESPMDGYTYIAWNQKKVGVPTIFADERVRQAMTMLIDRQRICDDIFLGFAKPATGPFSPLAKQSDQSVKPWPYDQERAKKLLKDAGFEDRNNDGLLENAQGATLKFKLTYPSKSETYERVVLLMKDNFARAGVVMEPDPTDWPILVKRLENREFDAINLGWTGGIESDIYQMFDSSQIKDNGDNCMSYVNPELDTLMRQARSEVDEAKRIPLWHKCQAILNEDQPYTFMTTRRGLAFYDNRVENVKLSRIGLNYFQRQVMPIPWYVPAAKQKWSK